MKEWLFQAHPVRGLLAVSSWLATIYFLAVGIIIPDAWWAIVAGINVFYFIDSKEK